MRIWVCSWFALIFVTSVVSNSPSSSSSSFSVGKASRNAFDISLHSNVPIHNAVPAEVLLPVLFVNFSMFDNQTLADTSGNPDIGFLCLSHLFTTHPITATLISSGNSETIVSTWLASPIRSMRVLPQVGQETTSTPPLRSPRVRRISFADLISSNGYGQRNTDSIPDSLV